MDGHQQVLALLLRQHQRQIQQQQGGGSSARLEPLLPRCVAAAASMAMH
jgi:hypothetical protein